jgi:hypothetical protein
MLYSYQLENKLILYLLNNALKDLLVKKGFLIPYFQEWENRLCNLFLYLVYLSLMVTVLVIFITGN